MVIIALACLSLAGCSETEPADASAPQEFLGYYNDLDQSLGSVAAEAAWRAATESSERTNGERLGAEKTLAAFRGSRYVIENSRRFFASRTSLSELEFRQLDKILLRAAESPVTLAEAVSARLETESRLRTALDAGQYCLEFRGGNCLKNLPAAQLDAILETSMNLKERRRAWEAAMEPGRKLKNDLSELRDLRNRTATALGYSSYFHLQVADYGMSVQEMLQLMDKLLVDLEPIYRELHLYARRRLAQRYRQAEPELIPSDWLSDRWGRSWSGMSENFAPDELFRGRTAEWVARQAEKFFQSLGWPPLPRSFWEKSHFYPASTSANRAQTMAPLVVNIDLDRDVRVLMNITPTLHGFEVSHNMLGQAYYTLAYANPRVPVVLREAANRAFSQAVGDLLAIASRQGPYLRAIGLLPEGRTVDQNQWLLAEALEGAVVRLPWSAGAMAHFEHDLYERRLPAGRFNRHWWSLVTRYQGLQSPGPRGEEFCDVCNDPVLADQPARSYDFALAAIITYHLHDYISRQILHQDPHRCNYYGHREVGRWLWEILSLGATRDWRQVIREKTGEEISSRALVEYFRPLLSYLRKVNQTGR